MSENKRLPFLSDPSPVPVKIMERFLSGSVVVKIK